MVFNFVHFLYKYISYTVYNIPKSGIYHNILLACCTRTDHLIPGLIFFLGEAIQVAALSCVCRWHLSCGILFIAHLEFWIAFYQRFKDWWLFYLLPRLTFTDSTFSPQIAFTFFLQELSSYTALTGCFYNRDECAYCAVRTKFRLSFVCKRPCHSDARVRYEASPCENFGGKGGSWNRFSPASNTPTLVFNPLCSYQKGNLAKAVNLKKVLLFRQPRNIG